MGRTGDAQGATRTAALAVLGLAAVVLVAVLLLRGGSYEVRATFQNASQLVKGNLVTVGGEQVGLVKEIELTDDGQADVLLEIEDGDVTPLRRGTRAVIKQRSLSGVANRFVQLQLGPNGGEDLADGARIDAVSTESAVELDEVFGTFDERTREGAKGTIRFFRDLNRGNEDDARAALKYLDPALASSSALFAELNRDREDLTRFIVQTGNLVTDLSARDGELAGLVQGVSTTMNALASRRDELSQAIETLPSFLRRTNTTFANLRGTLDDLDPVVAAARPVVRTKLRPLFSELRPFARDAAPTIRDLSRTIRSGGTDNDLIDLLGRQEAVDAIANTTAVRNGKERPGAFQAIQAGAKAGTPQLATLRPYSADLVGWFDDFSRSGVYDALGSFSRAGLALNQFTFTPAVQALLPIPLDLRDELSLGLFQTGKNNRCPGSAERAAPDGSNPYVPENIECDRSQVPVGK